jgi:penicillin-binding protein 1C
MSLRNTHKKKWLASLLVALPVLGFLFWPIRPELARHGDLSLRIFDANGMLLREMLNDKEELCYWAGRDRIAVEMKQAIVAAEDKRFYYHPGIDPIALGRSFVRNLKARQIVTGGSTITQQLARQVYGLPRKWYYKPIEMALAFRLECQLGKQEILEQYLNRMPYGNQIYGIETASRRYFNKPASHLSLSEASLLAGLPQSPTRYNPFRNFASAKERQGRVLRRMLSSGTIDSSRYDMAMATDLTVKEYPLSFYAPHFCQRLIRQHPAGQQVLRTTLDYYIQKLVEELVQGHLKLLKNHRVSNAAVLVLDNKTMAIKAYVGSADFFDADIQGQVDGVTSLRQPGSAIKPFTYGLALENGYTASTILADVETYAASTAGDFTVHNYDEKYHGPVRLRTALACSYNVPTVRLLESLGTELLLQRLHLAGMEHLHQNATFYGLGLTLGNGEVSLLELTRAFAALAREGSWHDVVCLQDSLGNERGRTIFSRSITAILTDILGDPQARAPAFGLGGPLHLPFDCAAKTGTTKDFRDNWTVGYTTRYTVGVWVGNFDGTSMRQISGITGAAPLFRDVMLMLHRQQEPEPFTVPEELESRVICSRSGLLPGPYCHSLISEKYRKGSAPQDTCTVHRMFYIDKHSGEIVQRYSRQQEVESKVFEVWPAEFTAWMQVNGMPLPPAINAQDVVNKEPLAVSFPDDGDVYKVDPILRKEYQTLLCTAVAPAHVRSLDWIVDDKVVASVARPFSFRWNLAAGSHKLAVRAKDHGQERHSEAVTIHVY